MSGVLTSTQDCITLLMEVKLVEENEWFKAGRFGQDYYLYAVLNAATQPELYVIQDPAANLQPQERMEVRYLIGVDQMLSRNTREE